LGSPLTGAELGITTGSLEQSMYRASDDLRRLVTFQGGEMMSVGWRLANGGRTWVPRYVGSVTEDAYDVAMKVAGGVEKLGRRVKFAGGVLGAVTGAAGQYGQDAGRKELSTTDKVGRVVAGGAYKGGWSFGGGLVGAEVGAAYGAAFGTAVPVPILGTVTGAAIGAVIGGVAGSGAGEFIADKTKGVALDLGAKAANVAVDGAKAAEDVVKGAGKIFGSMSPF
jgi:hypothetical protein